MTSLVAILPAASLISANAVLETAGFWPGNFSVVSFTGGVATHAGWEPSAAAWAVWEEQA